MSDILSQADDERTRQKEERDFPLPMGDGASLAVAADLGEALVQIATTYRNYSPAFHRGYLRSAIMYAIAQLTGEPIETVRERFIPLKEVAS